MQTAHHNLISIELTSEEINSAYAQTETFETTTTETEDSSKDLTEIKENRKLIKGHTSSNPTFRILINNIAGVNKYHQKLESIVHTMEEREIDVFLGQEINIFKPEIRDFNTSNKQNTSGDTTSLHLKLKESLDHKGSPEVHFAYRHQDSNPG